jgi:hypothetical protein
MDGGSKQKIPFLPVTDYRFRGPSGTKGYTKDIDIDAPVVFIGNGIVKENRWNSYYGIRLDYTSGNIDVTGKIVLFCHDFPDKINEEMKEEVALEQRVEEAAARKAAAVMLFSHNKEYPFLRINHSENKVSSHIPVISITRSSAVDILDSIGFDAESYLKEWETSGGPESRELIKKVRIKIKGNFENLDSRNFSFFFRNELISREEVDKIQEVNEKSLEFILDCFKKEDQISWEKLSTFYFRDYDSKVFYTHHWGRGMASNEGVYMVLEGGIPEYDTAVHENTHILTYQNWGGSSSFMSEGIGKYTQALASDKDGNHLRILQFLEDNKLYPLEEMIEFRIGRPGLKTIVGYPSSGSFVGFIAEVYGIKFVKDSYILEGRSAEEKKKNSTWERVFKKTLSDLEKEWHSWLLKKHEKDN